MSVLNHKIGVQKVSILNFSDSRTTEIHATGCNHQKKANHVSDCVTPPSPEDEYTDDYYHVAPCAR